MSIESLEKEIIKKMIAEFENAFLYGEYKKVVSNLMIDSTKPIDDATPYND